MDIFYAASGGELTLKRLNPLFNSPLFKGGQGGFRLTYGAIRLRGCESILKFGKICDFGNEESMTYSVFFAVFGDFL
jgi:hypothetical protein